MTTDLDELDALRAAATPGPWESVTVGLDMSGHHQYNIRSTTKRPGGQVLGARIQQDDAAFIVAACNAVGPLIERVREAEAENVAHVEQYRNLMQASKANTEAAEARVNQMHAVAERNRIGWNEEAAKNAAKGGRKTTSNKENKMKQVHVYPAANGDGWNVEVYGFDTQEAAIEAARPISISLGVELLISGEDGRFREKDSHGHDPTEIPG